MPDTSNEHRAQWKFNALYADTEVRRVSDDKLLAVVHAGPEQARIVGALKGADKPGTALLRGEGEQFTRFCPGCGSVGEVEAKFRDCCPDGAGARLIPTSLAQKCHELFRLALVGASQPELSEPQPNAALADGWSSELEKSHYLKALQKIGGPLGVSGQRQLRHLETGLDRPDSGRHIASGKDEDMLDAICTVVNKAIQQAAPPTLNASKEAGNG